MPAEKPTQTVSTAMASRAKDAETRVARLSEFIARLSHEMRNPLNAIIGFSELLQQRAFGPLGDAKYSEYVQHIRAGADLLKNLVDEVLDMSRIEAGHWTMNREPVAVAKLVNDAAHLLEAQAMQKGAALSIGNLFDCKIFADRHALMQVLLNLGGNAIKYCQPSVAIEFTCERIDAKTVAIVVADNGPGMSQDELTGALEPYGRGLAKQAPGTGLGLPIARALTLANGGKFTIASPLGKGTAVTLTFEALD
jgi:two-component system cell cycle sensor histidine kinase PleC